MLKNCAECNRVFSHPSRDLCQECYEKAQESFELVRDYLKQNPGASVVEVANETEVDLDLIYEYIEEGRLDVVPRDARLQCSICGDPIVVGRVCANCRNELRSTMSQSGQVFENTKPSAGSRSRMHTLENIRKSNN